MGCNNISINVRQTNSSNRRTTTFMGTSMSHTLKNQLQTIPFCVHYRLHHTLRLSLLRAVRVLYDSVQEMAWHGMLYRKTKQNLNVGIWPKLILLLAHINCVTFEMWVGRCYVRRSTSGRIVHTELYTRWMMCCCYCDSWCCVQLIWSLNLTWSMQK